MSGRATQFDPFVLARLEREGLSPSPETDPVTLLRRVSLDLTGLPPTPAEVDAFLADKSANAYEKVVDRLLDSPRHAERMAVRWLNAARYADTNGYQSDGERIQWRWRDWVIAAYHRNMPFDQFTIEQLAGDLLPNPTLEQKIATGFNRNHRGNAEGGIIPEEYAVEYVADRAETTATVWLGLTLGCARCHDHKFDPLKQKEYYQFFAYFNNVPERGRAIKYGNSPPFIKTPTVEQQKHLAQMEQSLTEARGLLHGLVSELDQAQRGWEKKLRGSPVEQWFPQEHLQAAFSLDGGNEVALGSAVLDRKIGDFGFYDRFSLSLWFQPGQKDGTLLSRMVDVERGEGYALRLVDGKLQLNLVKRWLDDALHVEMERRLEPGRWYHVLVTYDGSRVASGVRIYVAGRKEKLKVLLDDLNQTFRTDQPVRIGAGGGPASRFTGHIGQVRIYDDCLGEEEAVTLSVDQPVTVLAGLPADKRTAAESAKLRACFLDQHAPRPIQQAARRVSELSRQREQLLDSFPTTMVMEEIPQPRPAHVLIRGEYDKRGEKVEPGVPAALPRLPPGVKNNRLALARWLVGSEGQTSAAALTARVAVNRFWQIYFGTGLVKTVDDFGSQGEPPSHPELLDFLAGEFIRTGWNVKAMQKLIVTSAAYRQASRASRELLRKDPENRLLARGPRYRLPAEMIRDQALFVSGLLVEKVGGPSVKPYQPAGLEKELGADPYKQDRGEGLYRRSLYTFWKRTVAPPMMINFDAPGRETCLVRETRTNTPLQALNLLNEVTFVEAARNLAQRVLRQAGSQEQRLTLAFRLVLARPPRPAELRLLAESLEHHRSVYRKDPQSALRLLQVGESPREQRLDPVELAAFTNVAGVLLNLDETVTKE